MKITTEKLQEVLQGVSRMKKEIQTHNNNKLLNEVAQRAMMEFYDLEDIVTRHYNSYAQENGINEILTSNLVMETLQ